MSKSLPSSRTTHSSSLAVFLAALFLGTLALASVALPLFAAAGDLDPTFGRDGRVRTRLGPVTTSTDIVAQPDGKFVIVGTVEPNHSAEFLVVRYLPNGGLDPQFGTDGYVTTPFHQPNYGSSAASAVIRQPDGKLVAVGYTSDGNNINFAIARYQDDGSLDPTFGGTGMVVTGFDESFTQSDYAEAVALQPDGKLLVVGRAGSFYGMARYLPDGSPDPTFGTGGKRSGAFIEGRTSAIQAIALQPNGALVVAGWGSTGEGISAIVARFTPDGTPDATFGVNGVVLTDFLGAEDQFHRVALQPDGRILAAGRAVNPQHVFSDVALARYNPDGSLDPTFDEDGKVITALSTAPDFTRGLALLPDGRIFLLAHQEFQQPTTETTDYVLLRYTPEGRLDPTWDGDGIVRTSVGRGDSGAALTLQGDGNILVTGTSDAAIGVVRYKPDGSLDLEFGDQGGRITTNVLSIPQQISSLAVQPDGKLLAVGAPRVGFTAAPPQLIAMRYDAYGVLDPGFGVGGVVTAALENGSATPALALQPDGKVVVAGFGHQPNSFGLLRLMSNGSFDPGFDGDGVVDTPFAGTRAVAQVVAIHPDGKIVVAGNSEVLGDNGGRIDIALARYNPDGTLDPSFSDDGTLVTSFVTESLTVGALTIQPDGKLLIVGRATANRGADLDILLMRYQPDGSLDPEFGEDGIVTTDIAQQYQTAADVVVQADGHIVVAGTSWLRESDPYNPEADFVLLRYTPDGHLDQNFGTEGFTTTTFGVTDFANALLLQPDQKLVVAGYTDSDLSTVNNGDFALARYTADGQLDPSFGTGGTLQTDFYQGDDGALALALQGDGKFVAAGFATTPGAPGTFYFGLARYQNDLVLPPTPTVSVTPGPTYKVVIPVILKNRR